jgi:hypothetical protein
MSITTDFYRDLFQKGIQRSHSFNVDITLPASMGSSDNLRVRAEFTSIQTPALLTAIYRHGNTYLKVPLEREFEQITIGFLPDSSLSQHHVLTRWLDHIIYSHNLTAIDYYDNYLGEIVITMYDVNNKETSAFKLFEVSPTNITAIDINKTIKDDVARFTAGFNYNKIKPISNSSSSDMGIPSKHKKYKDYYGVNRHNSNTHNIPRDEINKHGNKLKLNTAAINKARKEASSIEYEKIIENMIANNLFTIPYIGNDNKLFSDELLVNSILSTYSLSQNLDIKSKLRNTPKEIPLKIKEYDNIKSEVLVTTIDNNLEQILPITDDYIKDSLNLLKDQNLLNKFSGIIKATDLITKNENEHIKVYELVSARFNNISRESAYTLEKIKSIFNST